MDWNIGYMLWMLFLVILTGWNVGGVLFRNERYSYKKAFFSLICFSVALLEELRMFAQWYEHGEMKMLETGLQTLPSYFVNWFLVVLAVNAVLIAVDLRRNRKDKK